MLYLKLFFTFLEIGTVSFGGGYGMLSLIREKVLLNGWLTEEELLNFVAVSESTPGPIAINMATFIGSSQGGFLGSLLCTLGVVLPAFCIILLIAAVLKSFMKYEGVQAFLRGVRPAVVALILATAVIMGIKQFFGFETLKSELCFDYKAFVIFAVLWIISFIYKKAKSKKPSPILMIIISAAMGMVFYGLIPQIFG